MSKVTISDPIPEGGSAPTSAPAETFTFKSKRGDEIVCGKPRGVLKLRLRDLLTREEIEGDAELLEMAKACLSIRTINGQPPLLRTRLHLETILQNTFGDDEDLDEFMGEFAKLVDPEHAEFVVETLKEAVASGITDPDKLKDFMTQRFIARTQAGQEKIRLS